MERHQQKSIYSFHAIVNYVALFQTFCAHSNKKSEKKAFDMIFPTIFTRKREKSEQKQAKKEKKTQTTINFVLEFVSALFFHKHFFFFYVKGIFRQFSHFLKFSFTTCSLSNHFIQLIIIQNH